MPSDRNRGISIHPLLAERDDEEHTFSYCHTISIHPLLAERDVNDFSPHHDRR